MTPLSPDALTYVLVQLLVLVGCARAAGAGARRLGQPAVVGYVAAGVVLGPSVLGRWWPGSADVVTPSAGGAVVPALAALGAVLLLALAGLEVDLSVVRERSRKMPWLLFGALVPALAAGFGLGWLLPDSFVGSAASRPAFAGLMAVALAISSPPVMSAVLRDLGLTHRSFAQVALSVAVATDLVGWVLLGVVVAEGDGAGAAVARALLGVAGLLGATALAWWAGPRLFSRSTDETQVAAGLGVVGGTALLAHVMGLEAVVGAFFGGIAVRRVDGGRSVVAALRPVVTAVLGPLFFVVAGLKVDVGRLGSWSTLGWTAALCVAATAAKVLGVAVPWRLAGRPRSESVALGAVLNVRGSLEIVLAGVGLAAGLLTEVSYTAVVVVAVVTSALAAPMVRLSLRSSDSPAASTRTLTLRTRRTSGTSGS